MQVFIVGTPYETAACLDKRRLNKQIIEAKQILAALEGKSDAWKNHPCVRQYRGHEIWLGFYIATLDSYKTHHWDSEYYSSLASLRTPPFHTEQYFNQMKRRLYTKDKKHYVSFAHLGESDVNWYWNDEHQRFDKYCNGKKIKEQEHERL